MGNGGSGAADAGLFVGLVLAAILFFAVPIVGSASPCGEADEVFANDLTADAEKAYREILADDPDSDCAADGMTKVIERRCEDAGKLLEEDEDDEAEKAYRTLLAMEAPSNPPRLARTCAFKGLKEVRKKAGDTAG